jgi:hypothetical protein
MMTISAIPAMHTSDAMGYSGDIDPPRSPFLWGPAICLEALSPAEYGRPHGVYAQMLARRDGTWPFLGGDSGEPHPSTRARVWASQKRKAWPVRSWRSRLVHSHVGGAVEYLLYLHICRAVCADSGRTVGYEVDACGTSATCLH